MLVLARSHKNVVRARRPEVVSAIASWEGIDKADLNRGRFLLALASSTDLAQRGLFDLAVQQLVQSISSRKKFRSPLKYDNEVTIEKRRAAALQLLEYMTAQHASLLAQSVLDVYRALVDFVPGCLQGLSLTSVRSGKFSDAATQCPYADLIDGLKTPDETRLTRTIHQAKGGEAEAVFVVLDAGEADHILNPAVGHEEHRITYVALSRAKCELFIYCPETELKDDFESLGLTTLVHGEPSSGAAKRKRATTPKNSRTKR